MQHDPKNIILVDPLPRRWTKEEYYRMFELGFFEGERVELIEGEVVRMPSMADRHALAITIGTYFWTAAFGRKFTVRVQVPLDFGNSQPEPDFAVIAGTPRSQKSHPKSALLVIEIADTTVLLDQTRKANVYAANKVLDYWLLNLVEDRLEVRREPKKDPLSSTGWSYSSTVLLGAKESIAPLALPRKRVKVGNLLP
ncbi:MAG: Uma2 family endonuclease [Tepidisphaeraceae bacterium]